MVKNYRTRNLCLQAMRITLLITFSHVFILTAIASGIASAQQISLDLKQTPVKKVFAAIEKQAGVSFTYSESTLSKVPPVDITVDRKALSEVLAELEKQIPLQLRQIGKTIAVSSKAAKNGNSSPPQFEAAAFPVSGSIKDAQGAPLPGVTVRVKGKTAIVTTDADGKFRIEADINDVLILSYIGFATREITIIDRNALTIRMETDMNTLQEVSVVSTGYQEIPKERATGSFSKVDNGLLNQRISTNLIERLDGVASGVLFNRSGNGNNTFSVRGQSTIYAANTPLIILDGFPFDGDLGVINPNDIEDVTVLKDASASSIWGVRAGNGVIVITTKKGKGNAPLQVNFSTNTTVGQRPNIDYLPTVSSASFIDMERTLFSAGYYTSEENNTVNRPALSPAVELLIAGRDGKISGDQMNEQLEALKSQNVKDDFSKYLLRNSVNQQYALNLNGGAEKVRYLFSAGYDKNLSEFEANGLQRLTLRSDNTFTPFKGFEIGAGIIYVNTRSYNNNPGLALLTSTSSRKGLYPYARLVNENGDPAPVNWQYRSTYLQSLSGTPLLDWQYRPLEEIDRIDKTANDQYARINASVAYNILSSLRGSVSYQYENNNSRDVNFYGSDSFYTRDLINRYTSINASTGAVTRPIPLGSIQATTMGRMNAHTVRGLLNFNKAFGAHEIAAIGGFEVKENRLLTDPVNFQYGYNENLLTSVAIDYVTLFRQYHSTTLSTAIPGGIRLMTDLTDRFRSYFSNAAYTYKQKYTVSASARIDASNIFGVAANQRSIPLWSIGGLWNIIKEPFFNNNILERLALRSTYGYSGNIDKSVTAFTTTRRTIDVLTRLPKAEIISPPNDDLKWERIGMFNIGVDFTIKGNRLSGSVEYYNKKGKDLLGFRSLDPTTGLSTYKGNVASMSGMGYDVQLNGQILDNDFKWQSNVIYSYATDEVTDLKIPNLTSLNVLGQTGLYSGTSVSIVPVEGRAVYGIYSYRSAGLDGQTGDPLGYLNGSVSKDYGALNQQPIGDLIYHGPGRPRHFGGWTNIFSLGHWSLFTNITYKLGYYFRRPSVNYTLIGSNWSGHRDYELRWQKPGDEAGTTIPSLPTAINGSRNDFYTYSEVNVSNGSHIRLQDISLSYELKKQQVKKLPFSRLRLNLYLNNAGILWRANKYGIDPDVIPNQEVVVLPAARTYSFGVQLTL